MCDGTPIIMQGMECSRRLARGEQQEQSQPTQRAERSRLTTRGSGGPYIAPPLRAPSLTLTQPSAGPYIPPPVNNPSERINQLNQSFPLNGGLGNNPNQPRRLHTLQLQQVTAADVPTGPTARLQRTDLGGCLLAPAA